VLRLGDASLYRKAYTDLLNNEDGKRSKELLSGFTSGDTGDGITLWLLHKL
jgi:hypothetical protein